MWGLLKAAGTMVVPGPLVSRIEETDRLIDQVVYRPCGLRAKEIEVVGGARNTGGRLADDIIFIKLD